MQGTGPNAHAGLERFLRGLCRCDGARDLAVVAALLVVAATLAIRLLRGLPAIREGVTGFC